MTIGPEKREQLAQMYLSIPALPEYVERFVACGTFRAEDPDRLSGIVDSHFQARVDADGRIVYLRVNVDSQDTTRGHVHLEISAEEDDGEIFHDATLDEISKLLTRFDGQELEVFLTAMVVLPISELPQSGLISTLLEVSTHSCGAELCLDGASMSIDGDSFTKLQWQLDDDDIDCVNVKLQAETASALSAEYLTMLWQMMESGLGCFVLETSEYRSQHARTHTHPQWEQHVQDDRT